MNIQDFADRNRLAHQLRSSETLHQDVPDDAERLATKSTKRHEKGRPISFCVFLCFLWQLNHGEEENHDTSTEAAPRRRLAKDPLDDVRLFDSGQSLIQSLEGEGQFRVVDT